MRCSISLLTMLNFFFQGLPYVQQFCLAAVGGVSSPFILQDIALETAKFLSNSNSQPVRAKLAFPVSFSRAPTPSNLFRQLCSNLRASFLSPVVSKCLQMYVQFINNRLYHIHHSPADYDDFVSLVHTARNAFYMTPGGMIQFHEVCKTFFLCCQLVFLFLLLFLAFTFHHYVLLNYFLRVV